MTKTPQQIRNELQHKGVSITAWAVENKLSPNLVFDLLAGRSQGLRGKAHRGAVLLGLKQGEIVEASEVKLTTQKARRAA